MSKAYPPRVRGNRLPGHCLTRRTGPTPARAGATPLSLLSVYALTGLPPRVRGNLDATHEHGVVVGPTPARAGQPLSSDTAGMSRRAYPRACEATHREPIFPSRHIGLPPRVRGNPGRASAGEPVAGPTPARAGQPTPRASSMSPSSAYPRACGATLINALKQFAHNGLPPRVRGNRLPYRRGAFLDGPTPARAGQPASPLQTRMAQWAYPRACGATPDDWTGRAARQGLPPRVRGNPSQCALRTPMSGPTPARAGQPWNVHDRHSAHRAYPRACGATDCQGIVSQGKRGLPPRVRGNLADRTTQHAFDGPTPARAGQPGSGRGASQVLAAYPRACGATC